MRRRLLRIALPVVAALALGGGALAYYTSTGSGSGSASAGTAQAVTLSAGTPSTFLYPGGSADMKLTASNPNPFAAHVSSLELDTSQGTNGFTVDGGHSGCDVSALSFAPQTDGWVVPAKVGVTNGTLAIDLLNAISMGSGAADACQGAAFTVYLKVGP